MSFARSNSTGLDSKFVMITRLELVRHLCRFAHHYHDVVTILIASLLSLSLLILGLVQTELLGSPDSASLLPSSGWTCHGCTGRMVRGSYTSLGKSYLTANRTAYWAGPMQTLVLDGRILRIGGYYSLSCQVKLVSEVPSPQTISVQLSHTLKTGEMKYTPLAEWRDITIYDGWIPLVSDFFMDDMGPVETMKLYISGPIPSVDFLTSQCSMKEFIPTDWKKDAYRRIESIRKGNMIVTVQTDKPLRTVRVQVEQIRHEFGFGSAIGAAELADDAAYRQWYLDNFEWAVIENAMKWRQNEWNQNRLTFEKADAAMKILKDNGKKVRGHTVFWALEERVPNWLHEVINRTELYGLCKKRVKEVVGRYEGRVDHWDVNNEMLLHRFYADAYGSDSIRSDMFRMVREVDADVKLFLNDFSIVSDGFRLGMFVGQAKSFLANGVPVQALGAQSHFLDRPRGPLILSRLDRLAAAGLPIWITELDYATPSEQELADALKDALVAFFSHPSVEGVLFWGFHANRESRAVLVDASHKTTAAGKMWQNLFHKVWRTNQTHTLGDMSDGAVSTLSVRGFYGDYKITISTDGTVSHTRTVTMSKSEGDLRVKIKLDQSVIGKQL